MSAQTGKALANCARAKMSPTLQTVTDGHQMGAVAAGGTEFPYATQVFFDRHQGAEGQSTVVLFTDVTAAYYSALLEVAFGAVSAEEVREK